MKTERVEVVDKEGKRVPADVLVCPECSDKIFHVFVIDGKHLHFQCFICDVTFCDGSCST